MELVRCIRHILYNEQRLVQEANNVSVPWVWGEELGSPFLPSSLWTQVCHDDSVCTYQCLYKQSIVLRGTKEIEDCPLIFTDL